MNIWNLTQLKFLWQFFYIDMYFQKQHIFCSEFFDCKYPVFKNTASRFQDEEAIQNINFNI